MSTTIEQFRFFVKGGKVWFANNKIFFSQAQVEFFGDTIVWAGMTH